MFRKRNGSRTTVNDNDTMLLITAVDLVLDAVDLNVVTMDAEQYILTMNLRNRLAATVGMRAR